MASPGEDTLLPVDGHVHLHPGVDLVSALDAAVENARRAGRAQAAVAGDRLVLCLVDPEEGARFDALRRWAGDASAGRWQLHPTGERASVLAERTDGARIAVVSGRQVRTAERFEVLVLAGARRLPGGEPLELTVDRGVSEGLAVGVAWGFGKWWRRRGERLRALLASPVAEHIFLGDNAGRLPCGPHLGILREARRRSVPVLPGSDPLPLPGHEQRIGQYGFLVSQFDLSRRPAAALRSRLARLPGQPPRYGTLDPPHRALFSQLRLRLPSCR